MELQKETHPAKRHGKWYDDACGTAFALELVGERWSLLIVRELMFGGRRFSDLRGGLPGISAKVLTERLEGLERAKIVQRRQLPPPAAAQVYELTPWGYTSENAIKELGRWAATSPRSRPDAAALAGLADAQLSHHVRRIARAGPRGQRRGAAGARPLLRRGD
jgi:DNA-binding HxlR family transcriptional regulator